MAFPDGWGRKCAVVIDSAYVSGTSHADFPLLLTEDILPSEMFDADGSYPALNGGGDIRFSSDSAGSTQLACEVVSFVTDNDPANGTAEIWVSVPTLSGSTDTTIYVWYNKTGETQPAVTDTYGRNAVWVDYEAVLHLNTSGYVDSTGNSHTGSANGSPSQSTTGHPWGGTWTYLPGTIARISLASSSGMLNGGDGALQVWFRLASLGINDIGIFGDWTTTGATDRAQIIKRSPGTGDQHRVIWDDGTAVAVTGAALTTNTTYKSTFTWNSSTGYLYKNGASDGSASVSDGVFDSAQSFILGSYYDLASDRHLNGYVGEARARRSYLSSDWVATEYNNQSAPGTFAAAGTPEAVGGGAYSLTADTGGFAATGTAAGLIASRKLAADSQSYALGGQSANLVRSFALLAESGDFTVSGGAASLLADRALTAALGAYSLSGIDAGLTYTPVGNYSITADAGAFALTGAGAAILADRALAADAQSYALTGIDAALTYTPSGAYSLAADSGSFALTGAAVTLTYTPAGSYSMPADSVAFGVTGHDAGLLADRVNTAEAGSFALTGVDAALAYGYSMPAESAPFALTGVDAGFGRTYQLTAELGEFTLTGVAATLRYSAAVTMSGRVQLERGTLRSIRSSRTLRT